MNFDAGTWWLALLLLGGLTGGFWFLLKRTGFERVDKLERSVGESVKKGDYDKDMKEVREDIEKIKANYITKRTSSGSRPRPTGSSTASWIYCWK